MKPFVKKEELGQTLIETVVAVFILTMGITSALGLAIYSFNASRNVTKQIVGVGLAREGIEAVKNLRDTNWLNQASNSTIDKNCFNYPDSTNTAWCYTKWLGAGTNGIRPYFCLDPSSSAGDCSTAGAGNKYRLGFDPTTSNYWLLPKDSANYGLLLDANNSSNKGFYSPGPTGTACADGLSSDFCRKITITAVTSAPYNQNEGPEIQVQSQVWWVDRNCPRSADWPGAGNCSIELDMFLTNWRDF